MEKYTCETCGNNGTDVCPLCCNYQGGYPDRWKPKTEPERLVKVMFDECENCKKAPPHISKCFSETGYCKYFPYEMPQVFGKREDLHEEKEES